MKMLFEDTIKSDDQPAGAAAWDRPFDPAEMLEWLGDDKPLAREVMGLFFVECPRLLAVIKAAIDSGDAHQVSVAAHTLRGAASNLTARRIAEAARSIEALGHDGTLEAVAPILERLEREAHNVLEVLRGLDRELARGEACLS